MSSARHLKAILDLEDFDPAVRDKLPEAIYHYVAAGAETETTLATNRAVFDAWRFVTRILVGVSDRQTEIRLFGRSYAAPFGIAPMGGSALVAYQAHVVMARAAAEAQIPFILSANSIIPLEEVAAANPNAWFASYQPPTREAIEGIVERCTRAGIAVLVLTADVAVESNKESAKRAGFSFPVRPTPKLTWDVITHPGWMFGVLARTFARRGIPHIVNFTAQGGPSLFSRKMRSISEHQSLTWEHVRFMRELWKGPLVIKGVLSPQDALMARDCGADGIIVSNHGGRQLDYAISTLEALPAIIAAASGLTVMIDSGFRRGTDVLKALALGAQGVFIGRPFLFATALAGQAGVAHAIELLRKEISTDMALLGVRRIEQIGREHLVR